jgi:hypothetical protein
LKHNGPHHAALPAGRIRGARASASLKLNQADVIGVDGSVRRAPPKRIGGYGEGETEVKDYRD